VISTIRGSYPILRRGTGIPNQIDRGFGSADAAYIVLGEPFDVFFVARDGKIEVSGTRVIRHQFLSPSTPRLAGPDS
jgi:hypothetical protein